MSKQDKEKALETLRSFAPAGTTIRTQVRHVSPSGMTRWISAYVVADNDIVSLDYFIAQAGLFKMDQRHEGLKVEGVGMDMGFHLVYTLSRALYPNGFNCNGNDGPLYAGGCPANDHSNDRRAIAEGRLDRAASYSTERVHSDGGYALNQRWLS